MTGRQLTYPDPGATRPAAPVWTPPAGSYRSFQRTVAIGSGDAVWEAGAVVAVVDRTDRRGFAYGTLDGHPVSGEEAFVLHRGAGGEITLTLRSLTRPGRGAWRLAFPLALVAQRWYRRRYARALPPASRRGPAPTIEP